MRDLVTISGAGLGGLVLAGALHRNGLEVVVYEGEASSRASRPYAPEHCYIL